MLIILLSYRRLPEVLWCHTCVPSQPSGSHGESQLSSDATSLNTEVPGSESNRMALIRCECKPDFYTATGTTGVSCVKCPRNANCTGGIQLPAAFPSYWLNGSLPDDVYHCSDAHACPGGVDACGEGYKGLACGQCEERFYRESGRCERCPEESKAFLAISLAVVLVLGLVVGSGLLLFARFVPFQLNGTLGIAIFFFQLVALIRNIKLNWPPALMAVMNMASVFVLDLAFFKVECAVQMSQLIRSLIVLVLPVGQCQA